MPPFEPPDYGLGLRACRFQALAVQDLKTMASSELGRAARQYPTAQQVLKASRIGL